MSKRSREQERQDRYLAKYADGPQPLNAPEITRSQSRKGFFSDKGNDARQEIKAVMKDLESKENISERVEDYLGPLSNFCEW